MIPLGFSAFVLFGGVLVLLGANQHALAESLSLDLSQTGLLGACMAFGIGLGVVVAGPMVDRFPRRPIFLAAILVTGAALVSVDVEMGFSRALVHIALVGFGGGVYDTLLNAVTVERYRDTSSRPLSLLHAGASVGAVLAPPVIGWLTETHDWSWSFRATGASYLVFALWVAAVPLGAPQAHAARSDGVPRKGVLSPAILALCCVAFAYVGVEGAITLFAVPYAVDGVGLSADRGRNAISVFWLGLLVGRVALGVYRGGVGPRLLSMMGGASVVTILVGVATGLHLIELWVFASGLALGGVFPLMVALAGRAAPHAPGTASGTVMGFGALGGFVVPWLAGALGDSTNIVVAMGALAVWGVVIAAAALFTGTPRRSASDCSRL